MVFRTVFKLCKMGMLFMLYIAFIFTKKKKSNVVSLRSTHLHVLFLRIHKGSDSLVSEQVHLKRWFHTSHITDSLSWVFWSKFQKTFLEHEYIFRFVFSFNLSPSNTLKLCPKILKKFGFCPWHRKRKYFIDMPLEKQMSFVLCKKEEIRTRDK